jgi:hypothetical protein
MRRHSLRIDGVDGGVFVGVVVVVVDELLELEIWWRGSGMVDETERENLEAPTSVCCKLELLCDLNKSACSLTSNARKDSGSLGGR